MSAASTFATAHEVAGPGWQATIEVHAITVSVSPHGDPLPDAIENLLAESQRRYWLVEYVRETDAGWDEYQLTRGEPRLV